MVNEQAVRDFLVESHEGFDRLDRELVAPETHSDDRERIASIFRTTKRPGKALLAYASRPANSRRSRASSSSSTRWLQEIGT